MLARQPVPGTDAGTWGDVLNEFMSVAHNPDGSLKTSAVSGSTPAATTTSPGLVQLTGDLAGTSSNPQIAAGAIVNTDISAGAAIDQSKIANLTTDLAGKYSLPAGGIPMGDLSSDVQTAIASGSTVADATTNSKGIIQLAGDLGGTATAPTVPGLASKYTLPVGGIPESDLSADVQAALTAGGSGNATSIQGRVVGTAAPNNGQALIWNEDSDAWEPQAPAVNSVTFPAFDYLSPSIAASTNFTVSTPWASASGTVLIRQIRIQVTDPTAVFDLKILRQNDFSAGGQNANLAFWVQSVRGAWMREFIWDYEDEDNTSQVHLWLANKSAVPSTVRILFNKRVAQ